MEKSVAIVEELHDRVRDVMEAVPEDIGTVAIVDVPIEIDGSTYIWKVKTVSYARKMELAKILRSAKNTSIEDMQKNPTGALLSGDVAMDLIHYQLQLLQTNVVERPDGKPVTKEYIRDLREDVANALLSAINPDMSVTQKK